MPKKRVKKMKSESKTGSKRGKRYNDKAKAELLAKYNQLRQSGVNAQEAAQNVGIPYITLRSWEKKTQSPQASRGRRGRPPATAPRAPVAQGGVTLVTPNGHRLEGIPIADVIRVILELQ